MTSNYYRSELRKILFWRCDFFCLCMKYLGEPLNGFAPNSHGRRVWSVAQTSLKVKVNFGGLRAVYVWKTSALVYATLSPCRRILSKRMFVFKEVRNYKLLQVSTLKKYVSQRRIHGVGIEGPTNPPLT